jgi:hypothetical protein
MPLYFYVHDADHFERRARPALAESWRRRSFEPCRALCTALLPAAAAFAARYHTGPPDALLRRVAEGLPFDRTYWPALVGEVLLYGAAELPEFETAPDTLCRLLAPDQCLAGPAAREHFAPIQQAHYGSRDLTFGARTYRPERAGYNAAEDVARLADYLGAVDPLGWTAANLVGLAGVVEEGERQEELEYVRGWFPALRELYQRARERRQVVVSEEL